MHLDAESLSIIRGILKTVVPAGVDVLLFGSRVHGRCLKQYSDIDICLRGKQMISEQVMGALTSAFAESDLPYRVDVVDWHQIAPAFREAIRDDLVSLQ